MRYGVSRQTLLIIAGSIWLLAGFNILRIGVMAWSRPEHYALLRIGEAITVFLLFFYFVFRRLFYKHTRRIEQKKDRSCPFSFFDVKSWIVMIVMITFGILARSLHLFPLSFISVFYVGLSSALLITGLLFLHYAWKRKKVNSRKEDTDKNRKF